MEALPKQPQAQGVVVIDVVDGEEEEQGNQTDNEEQEEEEDGSSSSSSSTEIIKERGSSVSETSSLEVDLESGVNETETKLHLAKVERDCRICHLSLDPTNQESGVPIELGCSCKDDLAAAHKHCAEAWFKIKGNR
ncbi:Zinc finger, RING-CH-type [Corchorus olitorius]|uniref:Zinc finger, RING-CH-type n=1 Tax=Corchorus olitorius TaxID=93759 RepID=A0A1R3I141_9ROSI|nr:Zinc finger, RING-CH-type [Corchorus olitorius]